ncbi:UNVERIFIED_ORG: hypothetical protein BCL66_105144 [Martelella mediterranea]
MHDTFLKFSDHAEALATFEAIGHAVDALTYLDTGLPAGMLIVKPVGASCDGIVYAPTGQTQTGENGLEYPVMAPVRGYHVNIRMADSRVLPDALAAFEVAPEPETPAERFA